MKKIFTMGQSQLAIIAVTSAVTGAFSWVGNYVLNSPAEAASSIESVKERSLENEKHIAVLQKSDEKQDEGMEDIKDSLEYLRRLVEQIAQKQGINIDR
jgi:hypothetical protein